MVEPAEESKASVILITSKSASSNWKSINDDLLLATTNHVLSKLSGTMISLERRKRTSILLIVTMESVHAGISLGNDLGNDLRVLPIFNQTLAGTVTTHGVRGGYKRQWLLQGLR